jgi:hypothetical protein
MAHYAKIENDIVTGVILADEDFIQTLDGEWIQTSYNTKGGVHLLGGTPLRKNYAGIGYTYDRERDAFIPHKPSEEYVLNEDKCIWELPLDLLNENSGSF